MERRTDSQCGEIRDDGNGDDQADTDDHARHPAVDAADEGHEERRADMGEGFDHRADADGSGDDQEEVQQLRPFTVQRSNHEVEGRMADEEFLFPRAGIEDIFQEAAHSDFHARYVRSANFISQIF